MFHVEQYPRVFKAILRSFATTADIAISTLNKAFVYNYFNSSAHTRPSLGPRRGGICSCKKLHDVVTIVTRTK